MAFVPYKHPKLAMIVVQQEPAKIGYYGGAVSAPVVRAVFKNALNILNVEPGEKAYQQESKPAQMPAALGAAVSGGKANTAANINAAAASAASTAKQNLALQAQAGTMPDLNGDTMYDALKIMGKYDIKIIVKGSGFLYGQSIKPGTVLENKKSVTLKFKH